MTFDRQLVVLHTTLPCLVIFWYMIGGRVEVSMKYISVY